MLIGAGGKPQQAGGAFRQAIARAKGHLALACHPQRPWAARTHVIPDWSFPRRATTPQSVSVSARQPRVHGLAGWPRSALPPPTFRVRSNGAPSVGRTATALLD
jgi:hypothetical protein